ncbi:hypothetical protein BDR22DRAFT_850972 [Usnea florida]
MNYLVAVPTVRQRLPKGNPDELNDTLCIPMQLDAFVRNTSVSNGAQSSAKIAPIIQPNYTS